MKNIKLIIVTSILITFNSCKEKESLSNLKTAWNNQIGTLEKKYINISFQESLNELRHSSEPWQKTNSVKSGIIQIGENHFLKLDTLTRREKKYSSKTFYNKSTLLLWDFGSKEVEKITKTTFQNQLTNSFRYSPFNAIDFFKNTNTKITLTEEKSHFIYSTKYFNKTISIYINTLNNLVNKVTVLEHHELFGDATTTFNYNDYKVMDGFQYPKEIIISKINGKVIDSIIIKNVAIKEKKLAEITIPKNYKIHDDVPVTTEVITKKHNKNIYFIDLKHTDDKILLVEFKDYFFVAEAPLNSENGELIINEAKKISPNKPIKYFAFGHYHPHYLGGIRAFVHKEATIITSKITEEYINYIITNSRKIKPDSLQIEPKKLKTKIIKDKIVISDGNYKMEIYFLGEKSNHTKDYLIYYFPKERLLFQDDSVWISRKGVLKKATGRQLALYNEIINLNLKVDTIIQSWPVKDYGVKTIIPFKELEMSVQIK